MSDDDVPMVDEDKKKKKKKDKDKQLKDEPTTLNHTNDSTIETSTPTETTPSSTSSGIQPNAGISIIAHPLANKKLTKKCLKLVKKASKIKQGIRRGVKEVVKAIRKGEKGSNHQFNVFNISTNSAIESYHLLVLFTSIWIYIY